MRKSSLILLVVLGLSSVGGCAAYNVQRTFVSAEENVKSKWGELQNQYQMRADLALDLVDMEKGAADFEQSPLDAVVSARIRAISVQVNPDHLTPEELQEFRQAQSELSQAVVRLLMATEHYPELKADQHFLSLQDQLEAVEQRIAVARKRFNDAVQYYNVEVRTFPNNIFARILGFDAKVMYEADPVVQEAPTVPF